MAANANAALYEELTRNTGVSALVSARIYPRMIPQDIALPAIAYALISNLPEYSQEGNSGLWHARYQIICVASTYSGAHDLAQAVRVALDGKRQLSTLRASCFVGNVFDRSEIGPEILENSVQVEVEVWYGE